jgi:hypothetical protein
VIAIPTVALMVLCGYARFDGAAICTVIFTEADVEPLVPLAVTVYEFCGEAAVGVPEIIPFDGLTLKPAGNAGLTEYELIVPETDGTSAVIACPTVALMVLCG